MSLVQWIWPESSDEKLAKWQSLYKFDYNTSNNWKKIKNDSESTFIEYFREKWIDKEIDTDINTKSDLKSNQVFIGLDNAKYEKNRLNILKSGFKAFQYYKLFH